MSSQATNQLCARAMITWTDRHAVFGWFTFTWPYTEASSCMPPNLTLHYYRQCVFLVTTWRRHSIYTLRSHTKQRYYSFITLANVDQFKRIIFGFNKNFALQPVSCFPSHWLCIYTTLQNLKSHFYHFTTTAVTKTYLEIHSVFLLNVIHIIWRVSP